MPNVIGIVGGGQLGRMLTQAAHNLGFQVYVIDPTPQSPAGQIADKQLVADFKDENVIRQLASMVDFLTFEIELANADILNQLSSLGVKINPGAETLKTIKDKFLQKQFLKEQNIPVADFILIEDRDGLNEAIEYFGYPFILKARFDAYDGRGNTLIKGPEDIQTGLAKLKDRLLYAERFVPFIKELAVVATRGSDGQISTYPVVETIHKNNICHMVLAPAPVSAFVAEQANIIAAKTLEHLQGAGVFAVEMFLTKDDKVLVNEIAPRVHNSGHFSIEGAATSQFEQHVRAITGLPLGETKLKHPAAVMINILGDRVGPAQPSGTDRALAIDGVSVHIYGKHEVRPERKMGHITATAQNLEQALKKAQFARAQITI
ncbi:MAG: 5-(carboxyamino)imidazole ribonucleotide synthase [Candidatus Doudnabacteria bacterium]|nr:5-(carboxyamino)imidazole ribonucleotide synthase [Candidatus Doudnabacteria bacterium]